MFGWIFKSLTTKTFILVNIIFIILSQGIVGFYVSIFTNQLKYYSVYSQETSRNLPKLLEQIENKTQRDEVLKYMPNVYQVQISSGKNIEYEYLKKGQKVIENNFSKPENTIFLSAEQFLFWNNLIGYAYNAFGGFSDASVTKPRRVDIVIAENNKKNTFIAVDYSLFEENFNFLSQLVFLFLGSLAGVSLFAMLALYWKFLRPLKKLQTGALHIAQGNLHEHVDVSGNDEIGIVGRFFNEVARNLQNVIDELVEKEKLTDELNIATRIQNRLLPLRAPDIPGLNIKAGNKPASQVGGDAYDYIPVDDDNIIIYVGDVSGHGVPAGLVMTMADVLIHGSIDMFKDIKDLLAHVNKNLTPKLDPAMFMTMLMLNWNHSDQKMTYVGAGHETLIHYQVKRKKINNIKAGGIALGMIPDNKKLLHTGEIIPEEGDVFVLYSDGIPEAWGGENGKEMFGADRLLAAVEKYGTNSTAELIFAGISDDLGTFMGNFEQKDDITLMVIKYNGIRDHEKSIRLDVNTVGLIEQREKWDWRKS